MLRHATGVCFAALITVAPVQAQITIEFEDYSLENGLRVLLAEHHGAPVVTVNLWYNVGSRNERVGRSGIAHLFEHMMFEGSENVPKRDHPRLIQRAGGSNNGTTNSGRTNYFETLPANRLNLGLWLEADRMRSLAINKENLDNQREVVKEERRRSYDNQPYATAFLEGSTLLYDSTDCFAYAHSTIGSMDDLNAAEVEELQAFFDLYYAPNNATLAVVGDFDPAEAKRLIELYFGDIPRGQDPPSVECSYGFDVGPRSRVWEDQLANLPAVIVAYRVPPHAHPDTPALQLLGTILGTGESSRFNRAMVRESKTALQALAQIDSRRGPGMFLTLAIANQGIEADTLEQQLQGEVARIVREGVSDQEIDKARNDFRAGHIFGMQTSSQIADRLQHYAHYHDSIDDIHSDLERYMAVTAEALRDVAAKYLVEQNSYVITIVPKAAAQGEGVIP